MKYDKYIIYSDMDQTAIGSDGNISGENIAKIKYFQENGGMFAFATGRQAKYFTKYNIAINAPIICVNGTLVYDFSKEKNIYKNPLDDKAKEVFKAAVKKHGKKMAAIYTFNEETDNLFMDINNMTEVEGPILKHVFIFHEEGDALEFMGEMKEKFSSEYQYERSWSTGVEMLSKSAGKGSCIEFIKSIYKDRKVICVGDYENDISMLEVADIPIAVSNAIESLKEKAEIIAPSCNENAIAWIIDNIGKTII